MGYRTSFNARITVSGDKLPAVLAFLNTPPQKGDIEEVDTGGGNTITFRTEWKNYDDDMQKLCAEIVKIDPTATGEVDAQGDEPDDHWRIDLLGDGKVHTVQSHTAWDTPETWEPTSPTLADIVASTDKEQQP